MNEAADESGSERLVRLFRMQAEGCRHLGSSLYGTLLDHAADDITAGGPVAAVLEGHEADPGPSALALRLAGSVHRIVLDGRAPDLARWYPSVGGRAYGDAAWPDFRDVVRDNAVEVRSLLASPPQTNEVGRSAVLIGGLLHVAASTGLPIRLLEVGASAGLNLRVDAFRFEFGGGRSYGPAGSPVVLDHPWAGDGSWPPLDATVEVVERRGCDVEPIDASTEEGWLRLACYVWPDQLERFDRLRGAVEVAATLPAPVEQMPAARFLARELTSPTPGVATVVWHSIVRQYLDRSERDEIEGLLQEAGQRAVPSAPLAWINLEPRRQGNSDRFAFVAAMTQWPGGTERILGRAAGHGPPVHWFS